MAADDLISITENISFIQPTRNPLSANVVFIYGKESVWIYDVGASLSVAEKINSINMKKNIVLSHFHKDHITNLSRVSFDELFVGTFTKKHTEVGTVVTSTFETPRILDAELELKVFNLPSSHAKSCLALQCGKYLFVGDGTYCTEKNGHRLYNSQILQQTIEAIESSDCEFICPSHERIFVQPKNRIINLLKDIYSKRTKTDPFICVDYLFP